MLATDPSIVPKSPDAIIFSSFTPTMAYFLDTQPNDVAVRALELRWNFDVCFQHFQQESILPIRVFHTTSQFA